MKPLPLALLALAGAALGAVLAGPAPAPPAVPSLDPAQALADPFTDPALPAALREPSPARTLLERQCLTCHGLPIVAGQRLTPTQWQAVLTKMRDKFHAPLVAGSDDERQIADLLALALPPDAAPAPALTLTVPTTLEPTPTAAALTAPLEHADPTRGATPYAFYCSQCHAMDARGGALGPRLLLRPSLADPRAFIALIAEGRRGMPPLPGISEEDALDILAHLRSLGRPPA